MMESIHQCVSLCVDNVKDVENVEKVFVMLWKEKSASSMMYDYEIDGKFVRRHEASDYASKMVFPTFDELQKEYEKLEVLFNEDNREFPVAFKIIYSPKTNKFHMHLEYELITERTHEHISIYYEEWVKNKIGMTTLDAKELLYFY